MAALAPLNLLVILNTHVPQEVLGEVRVHEDDIKNMFKQHGERGSLNGHEKEDTSDEDAANEKFQPSAALLRSLKSGCHSSGGGDDVGDEEPPAYASHGLGAAARCSTPASCKSSRSSYGNDGQHFHGDSGLGHSMAGTALLGAMGIAAFGYSPKGSSSGSRGVGAAFFRAMSVAAFGAEPSAPSTDKAFDRILAKGKLGSESTPTANSSGHSASDIDVHTPIHPGGLYIGGATSSKSNNTDASSTKSPSCQCSCPNESMVLVPRHMLEQFVLMKGMLHSELEEKQITLVMSPENILSLTLIAILSIFGAIYLWKICTRRRCVCKLCRNQYRTLHLLGSGGYGSVYLVDRVADGSQFVAKKIPVRDITEFDEYSLEAKELVKLRHKHIVSYEDDFVHVEYGTLEPKPFFVIIMEFCAEGDLKEKIEVDFCSFTEDYVRTVFAQLLDAVQYLHSKNVIHRDLKSQNVFLDSDGGVKLGDFGLCKHSAQDGIVAQGASLTHAGTDCYMAPEMLSSSKYGKPADMWSLGCVLFELVTGQFMWELDGILGAMIMKNPQIVQKLLKVNLVPCVGATLVSLLKRLLSASPAARPTVTTCLRKKVFKPGFHLSKETFGESLGEPDDVTPTPPLTEEGTPSTDPAAGFNIPDGADASSGVEEDRAGKSDDEEAPDDAGADWLKPKRRKNKKNLKKKASGTRLA